MEQRLTHLDESGRADMVDVGSKPDSERIAVAAGQVKMLPETLALIEQGALKKGDVLTIARIAGIMAAKRTSELIPLCHPIPLNKIAVDITLNKALSLVEITATARTTGKTGVEMEALTAVSIAALTIYDMAKAVDRGMQIEGVRLLEKRGGIHGDYVAPDVEK
jgi:cyclic pyranopterin phosphate synthase